MTTKCHEQCCCTKNAYHQMSRTKLLQVYLFTVTSLFQVHQKAVDDGAALLVGGPLQLTACVRTVI